MPWADVKEHAYRHVCMGRIFHYSNNWLIIVCKEGVFSFKVHKQICFTLFFIHIISITMNLPITIISNANGFAYLKEFPFLTHYQPNAKHCWYEFVLRDCDNGMSHLHKILHNAHIHWFSCKAVKNYVKCSGL